MDDLSLEQRLALFSEGNALCKCSECPLGRGGVGGRRVRWRGNPQSPYVIVGEMPGVQEVIQGRNFIGPSGELLKQSFPVGFELDKDALVVNAIQCYLKSNPNRTVQQSDRIKQAAVNACNQRLLREIAAFPRKSILALGKWAAYALTGDIDFKPTIRRGEIQTISLGEQRIPVVHAVHPAFLLRGGGSHQAFRQDLDKSLSIVRGSLNVQGDITRRIVCNMDDVHELFGEIRRSPYCAADFETTGLNYLKDTILMLSLYPMDGCRRAPVGGRTAWVLPRQAFAESKITKELNDLFDMEHQCRWIWHNGKFDIKFAWMAGMYKFRVDEDLMMCAYALNEAAGAYDLEAVARTTIGAEPYKIDTKKYLKNKKDSFAKIPTPLLTERALKDVTYTGESFAVLREKVRADKHCELLYTRTLIPASNFLARVEWGGIYTDARFVAENRIILTKEISELLGQVHQIAGCQVNPNSPEQMQDLLYDRMGLNIKGKRPTDTRKETLDKIDHPIIKAIKDYRNRVKVLSTYVLAIEVRHVNGWIHTTYKLHRTPTGRLSSSEPNIQNIPREARLKRMYRAPRGLVLIEGDYNTAELRLLAALSGDEFLTSIFMDNSRNLHDEVSVKMYGPNWTPDQRIRAKAINFGIPYGREAFSIAVEFDIETDEAQRLIDEWFAAAPKAEKFINRCRSAPILRQNLVTVFGRKRRPGVVSPERLHGLKNEFSNFPMQSTISDFCLHSAMDMEAKISMWDARTVNLVHDSNLIMVPDDSEAIRECALIMRSSMERIPKIWMPYTKIPFLVDLKLGHNWGLLEKYNP